MGLSDAFGNNLGSILSSTAAGAASGSVIPGWGTIAGAAIGLGTGLVSANEKNKTKALLPSEVDPQQQAMERYYARMRTAYQTGTAQASQRADLQATTQQALKNAFKFGGASTDVASIKDIYLKGVLGLNQQGQQMEGMYADKQSQAINDISQRKLDIQGALYDQAKVTAENDSKNLSANTNALLTALGPKDDKDALLKTLMEKYNSQAKV